MVRLYHSYCKQNFKLIKIIHRLINRWIIYIVKTIDHRPYAFALTGRPIIFDLTIVVVKREKSAEFVDPLKRGRWCFLLIQNVPQEMLAFLSNCLVT